MAATGTDPRTIERIYAHFHRVLAALFLRLQEETAVTWLTEERHSFSGDYEENTYAPAVYVTGSLDPYARELAELSEVQAEALEVTGRARPGRNLLPPLTEADVTHVRISTHEGQTGRTVGLGAALARLEQLEAVTVSNLRKFEDYTTRHDPARRQVEKELADIRAGIALLSSAGIERLRETYAQTVIRPYLYFLDGSSRQLHMRRTGLIVAGPAPQLSWRTGPRRTRSDKIDIPPLVEAGPVKFYSADAWEAARDSSQSG